MPTGRDLRSRRYASCAILRRHVNCWLTYCSNNYSSFTLDPGEHYFCSTAENKSVFAMKVEAGKTYFVQQKIRMGFMKASNKLDQITNEEGQKGLTKCHPSSFTEKK